MDYSVDLLAFKEREYLSPAQAAAYLGIALSVLRAYVREGVLPAAQFVRGGRILVRRSDCDAFVDAHRVGGSAAVEASRQHAGGAA
ncbi:hypothetical protein Back2_14720 [Nocardioides baekrokdamisoli]|uniref:Helix-turn-helix domain-containing protein n=1 Tax=Nocardioides baekrokdamisoli TaxID=1804624 RepID=A0A3G9IMF1_9ACTN|nr:helix-turn-helix domain-containing protein [Nocardioides baekrokdamisoli]BBH17185.1 hypothetical protein Back2_14720 [Nocardioides baekrokdamisoli]